MGFLVWKLAFPVTILMQFGQLYLVCVQQGLRILDLPADGQGELPCEVGGVPHPRAHPLSHEGRRQVGGVTGDEYPPRPPPLGHFRLELTNLLPF